MLKIRRSRDRLIFNMGIPIPGKDSFILRRGPGPHIWLQPLLNVAESGVDMQFDKVYIWLEKARVAKTSMSQE